MSRLNVFTPFGDLRREIDRLFDAFGGGVDGGRMTRPRAFPAINVWEDAEAVYAEAELPGVRREDLEITAVGNELTLSGRRQPAETENVTFHRQERGYGEFTRVLALPVEVDADKIEATLRHGVLTLRLPKAEAARARKITVRAD
ncbi:MAG: heat-shock protein [Phycisphaerae bacterium]